MIPERKDRVTVCEVCGAEFVRNFGRTPHTCGREECQAELHRRRAREYRDKRRLSKNLTTRKPKPKPKPISNGPYGLVRPYTNASNLMIRRDLAKGWTVMQIAMEYGRDPADVAKHIQEMQRGRKGGKADNQAGSKKFQAPEKGD